MAYVLSSPETIAASSYQIDDIQIIGINSPELHVGSKIIPAGPVMKINFSKLANDGTVLERKTVVIDKAAVAAKLAETPDLYPAIRTAIYAMLQTGGHIPAGSVE